MKRRTAHVDISRGEDTKHGGNLAEEGSVDDECDDLLMVSGHHHEVVRADLVTIP